MAGARRYGPGTSLGTSFVEQAADGVHRRQQLVLLCAPEMSGERPHPGVRPPLNLGEEVLAALGQNHHAPSAVVLRGDAADAAGSLEAADEAADVAEVEVESACDLADVGAGEAPEREQAARLGDGQRQALVLLVERADPFRVHTVERPHTQGQGIAVRHASYDYLPIGK